MTDLHELAVERTFAAPREAVWRAVTDHLAEWWAPRPWTSEVVAIDWRGGGRFAIVMHGPEGESYPGDGILLEVVPGERFVFTNVLAAGWTPREGQPVGIVGTFALTDAPGGGTCFRSSAKHWSAADRDRHAAMGFEEGWGVCADQLGAVADRLAERADA